MSSDLSTNLLQELDTNEYSSKVLSLDSLTDPTKLIIDTDNSDLSEGELTILLHFKVSDYNSAFAEVILAIEAPDILEVDQEKFIPFVPIFNIIEDQVFNIDENSPADEQILEESE